VIVRIKLEHDTHAPVKSSLGAAAFDLLAVGDWRIPTMDRHVIPCGFSIEIPSGYAGMICPRSGLAAKKGITVLNAPGIIDSDYRGEVGVCLINLGTADFFINGGDRIAQMLIVPAPERRLIVVDSLNETGRDENGWGSTGGWA